MNVRICALKGDLSRNKPLKKCFQSYKVTSVTKREQRRAFHSGFSGGNDQSVFVITGCLIIVINYPLPGGHGRWP